MQTPDMCVCKVGEKPSALERAECSPVELCPQNKADGFMAEIARDVETF